jgi:hypothetical protein
MASEIDILAFLLVVDVQNIPGLGLQAIAPIAGCHLTSHGASSKGRREDRHDFQLPDAQLVDPN